MNKSPGPDDIHPWMLRELAENLAEPLETIFKKSLSEGVIPLDWKNADVTPIFKKGAKNLAENYRPISLTSVTCKLMESIVKENRGQR